MIWTKPAMCFHVFWGLKKQHFPVETPDTIEKIGWFWKNLVSAGLNYLVSQFCRRILPEIWE